MKTIYLKSTLLSLFLVLMSAQTQASRKDRYASLYSSSDQEKRFSINGVVGIPQYVLLTRGFFKSKRASATVSYDNSVECTFNNRKKFGFFIKYYFDSCTDGSRPGDRVRVSDGVGLRVNSSSSLTMKAIIKIYSRVRKGVKLPDMNASAGQVLEFDGELWVPSDGLPSGNNSGDILIWDGSSWTPSEIPQPQSSQGPQGEPGLPGAPGPQGLQGLTGETGPQGLQGPKGETGAAGPQGLQGPKGEIGAAGPQGLQGPKGETGAAGPQGLQGIPGQAGVSGAQGLQGIKGDKGDKGDQGIQGLQGLKGDVGAPGLNGAQGPAGSDATVALVAGAGILAGSNSNATIGANGVISVDVGNGAGQIPQLDAAGKLPASVMPEDTSDSGGIKVAFIKDIKPNGTHGGDCVTGDWRQRTLNSLETSEDFVSLVSNQITLAVGTYMIEVQAPAYLDNIHKAILRNITSGAVALAGTTGRSHPNYGGMNSSFINGKLVVSTPTTFEVQHRCTSDRTIVGFGIAANFGVDEVYTQIKVIKLD